MRITVPVRRTSPCNRNRRRNDQYACKSEPPQTHPIPITSVVPRAPTARNAYHDRRIAPKANRPRGRPRAAGLRCALLATWPSG